VRSQLRQLGHGMASPQLALIALHVCRGLAHMLRKDIHHLDVKPDNIVQARY
jgi:hypothetical protein